MLSITVSKRQPSLPSLLPISSNQKIVGERQAASQGIGQQLAGKAAHEIVFAVVANVLPDSLQSLSFDASRKRGPGIDRAPAQIVGSTLADRIERFERQSERVESRMTARRNSGWPDAAPAFGATAGPSWPHRPATRAPPGAAAGFARPVCSSPPSSRASPDWSAGPARSSSKTRPSATGRPGRSGRRRGREPNRSHRPLPAACRSDGPEPDSRTCREHRGSRGSNGCAETRPGGSESAPRTSPLAIRR